MLYTFIQIAAWGSYLALLVGIWRAAKKPKRRTRAVFYGWGLSFVWSLLWALLIPELLRPLLTTEMINHAFPDGLMILAMLVWGWFWPLLIVLCTSSRDSSAKGEETK